MPGAKQHRFRAVDGDDVTVLAVGEEAYLRALRAQGAHQLAAVSRQAVAAPPLRVAEERDAQRPVRFHRPSV